MDQTSDSPNRSSEDSAGEGGESQDQIENGITKVTEYYVSYSNAKSLRGKYISRPE